MLPPVIKFMSFVTAAPRHRPTRFQQENLLYGRCPFRVPFSLVPVVVGHQDRLASSSACASWRKASRRTIFMCQLAGSTAFLPTQTKKHPIGCFFVGAGSRGRTDTVSLPTDFESVTSANSIIPAKLPHYYITLFSKNQVLFEK